MNTQGTPIANASDRVGQLISGRYRIDALLGEGGMGAVYLAEHTLMKKRFALKLLHPEMAQNEEIMARFRREAEAAAHLEHPHVVAATDFGETGDGAFFLVLEYVDGTSLREALGSAPFAPGRALRIARQIALALERAHDAGIVHRDLKPENVMLVRKGEDADFVKVLDFGVARFEPNPERDGGAQPLTRVGTVVGTPEYMSPEQAYGERVTARADLYALGVVLYEMLTGVRPFDGEPTTVMSMHIVAPFPPMAERAPNVTVAPAIEAVVRRLMEKDPGARHPTARALIDAIDEAAAASGVEMPIGGPSSDRMSVAIAPPAASAPTAAPGDVFAKTAMALPAAEKPAGAAGGEGSGSGVVAKASEQGKALVAVLRAQVASVLDRLEKATKLPRPAVIALAVGALVLMMAPVLVVVVVFLSRPSPGTTVAGSAATAVAAPGKAAPADKVRAAAAKGPAALEALAEEYPGDPAVLRELAFSYDTAGRTTEALGAVRRLSDVARDAVPRDVVRVVMRAASKFEASDEAFQLLEERLGASGVDALLELSQSKDVPASTRTRATKSLQKTRVRANATPAAAFLIDLNAATTCDDRKEALVRAGEHADGRALGALKALKNRGGCGRRGRHDCNPCLRGDDALDRAIAAAEAHASE